MQSDTNLIWIDLEMTGLDSQNDDIIEIATIVTDTDLNILAEGPVLPIYQAESVLAVMNSWCVKQHGQSGLTERVRQSKTTMEEAERLTLEFLSMWVPKGRSPMCGNSICQDRRFLARQMPELERYFHYRHLDVSTIKILAERWNKPVYDSFTKESSHLALQDIKDSIAELKHYREHFLRLA